MAQGVADAATWLNDLVRNGLAQAQTQPYSFWERPAARLVDAQAPGVARLLRAMAGTVQSGEGWADRMLEDAGKLHLLLEGYSRLDALPPGTQADVRSLAGWTQSQEEVSAQAGERDRWLVVGQKVDEEEKLRTKRTWLWGEQSGKTALVLHFAYVGQPLDASLVPGTMLDATLAFYPGAYAQRAIVKERHGAPTPIAAMPGDDLLRAVEKYSAALVLNPWIERFPMLLSGVVPEPAGEDGTWLVRSEDNRALPVSPHFSGGWQLLALSGGHPLRLFGEWDGRHLLPMSAWSEYFVQL